MSWQLDAKRAGDALDASFAVAREKWGRGEYDGDFEAFRCDLEAAFIACDATLEQLMVRPGAASVLFAVRGKLKAKKTEFMVAFRDKVAAAKDAGGELDDELASIFG